jgi:hypothetical protein
VGASLAGAAFADVVLIGAGTLTGSPRGSWTPERAFPPGAGAFVEFRRRLGRSETPELAILSGRGSIVPTHPALQAGALVLTSEPGAAQLRRQLPDTSSIVKVGSSASAAKGRTSSSATNLERESDELESLWARCLLRIAWPR